MSIIADATFIRKSGVMKMVKLPVPQLTDHYPEAMEFLFLVRPSLSVIDLVIKAIRWGEGTNYPLITGTYPSLLTQHLKQEK